MPKAKSQRKPTGKGAKADRINKIVRRAGKKRGYTPFWLREMGEADLDFLESYTAHYELIGARSVHIPLKYKELITLAVLAVEREDFGNRNHVRRAFRLGATKEEIIEAIQTASLHTGALTLVYGMKALMGVLEEEEEKKK